MKRILTHPITYTPPAAFSLVEILLSICVIGIFCAMALAIWGHVRNAVRAQRLERDAERLNNAVQAYLANGGSIPVSATGDEILNYLKSELSQDATRQLAGAAGPFLDRRLMGDPAGTGGPRIVWRSPPRAFEIDDEGVGWAALYLDESAGTSDYGEEERRSALRFAKEDPWIWDYEDRAPHPHIGPVGVPTSDPDSTPFPPGVTRLAPPTIVPESGVFQPGAYPLNGLLINPNPAGSSRLQYRLNDGEWLTYSADPIVVDLAILNRIEAYAESLDPDLYIDSQVDDERYLCYYESGDSTLTVAEAGGEPWVNSHSADAGRTLGWGAELGEPNASRLAASEGNSWLAGENEWFALGQLTYHNGTTRAGTNVESATLTVAIDLDAPEPRTIALQIPVGVVNTIHYPWTPADEQYDTITIGKEVATAEIITILNRDFQLKLKVEGSFTDHAAAGSDAYEVHVGEGSEEIFQLSGALVPE